MKIEVKVPSVGESITEATIGSWAKKNGEFVKRNDIILLLETDKASVEVVAENDGVLQTLAGAGSVVKIGATVGNIDTEGKATATAAVTPPPIPGAGKATPPPIPAASASASGHLSPAVQRIVSEKNLDPASVVGTGKDGRLTKADVLAVSAVDAAATASKGSASAAPAAKAPPAIELRGASKQGDKKLVPMTTIRKRIAERLVEAQHTAAILTTFNEIDMTKVIEIRNKYKEAFKEKYSVNLGFMGFFVKATIEALKAFPAVNASIVGTDIEYHNYYNVGVAVSTERGLMVPVIKDADLLSVAGVELAIRQLATKGRDGKISIDDLNGGTFSITNGGVFGSLLSTPILNPPQSAILGMHKLQDRPMAINGKVEIRKMMYVALSYDHRIIDGKEAVGFLVKIKEGVEDPERLLIEV
ncbi:MAG: 2-oxoglutarate dehydrogenase complex dihydrolipoyllysine-residue succinyltransferase [Pseudobdellovibrionaceae bacterium]